MRTQPSLQDLAPPRVDQLAAQAELSGIRPRQVLQIVVDIVRFGADVQRRGRRLERVGRSGGQQRRRWRHRADRLLRVRERPIQHLSRDAELRAGVSR
jgi:hypothetical protein